MQEMHRALFAVVVVTLTDSKQQQRQASPPPNIARIDASRRRYLTILKRRKGIQNRTCMRNTGVGGRCRPRSAPD